MTALDTNVIVRVIVRDDPAQAAQADNAMSRTPLWVSKTVLLEVEWVLRGAYGIAAKDVNRALRSLVGLEGLITEDFTAVLRAIGWHAAGADFADALHLASAGRCDEFISFDRRLARAAGRLEGAPPVRLPRSS